MDLFFKKISIENFIETNNELVMSFINQNKLIYSADLLIIKIINVFNTFEQIRNDLYSTLSKIEIKFIRFSIWIN